MCLSVCVFFVADVIFTGEDQFKTQATGFSGAKNMVVGFEAPSLVYYRSDYTEVHCETQYYSLSLTM